MRRLDVAFLGRGEFVRRPIDCRTFARIEQAARRAQWRERWKVAFRIAAAAAGLIFAAILIAVGS
jgi:hypothetical protein